jgi:hypothetical protein
VNEIASIKGIDAPVSRARRPDAAARIFDDHPKSKETLGKDMETVMSPCAGMKGRRDGRRRRGDAAAVLSRWAFT